MNSNASIKIDILTISGRASKGIYENISGKVIETVLNKFIDVMGTSLQIDSRRSTCY